MSALVLAGIVLSGAWTQLDEIGWIGWLPLALAVMFDAASQTSLQWRRPLPSAADRSALWAAVALCALLLAHPVLTFREEFGFGGDEGYHLSATRAFAIYFMRAGPLLAAALVGYGILAYKRMRFAGSVAIAALTASSFVLPESALFGRYPTGFYLLATPLNVAFEVMHSPYPYSANHIVNALSLPVWLFALRPLLFGRWPDWRVMPVALLVYVQPSAVVLLSSPLLEPWAVVCGLLALEAIATLPFEQRWVAVPLCVAAVCFKETFILFLPTVWLLSCVEWRGGRPAIRRGAIALGIAALAPFLAYYAVRATLTSSRGYEVATAAHYWSQARLWEWISNARAQAGAGSLLVIVAAMLVTLRDAPLWIATAIGLAVFFFADAISAPWTGYSRFLAYSLIAVCGAVLMSIDKRRPSARALVAVSAVILVLQLPATMSTLALDLQPDHERNSLEWNRVLIRMPLRKLASGIPSMAGGAEVRRIRVITFGTDLTSLPVAYPDLAARYELVADPQAAASLDCRCRDNAEAILAGFEWPANLGDTASARESFSTISAACVSQVETTCLARTIERDRRGQAVGALGIGRTLLLASPQHDEGPKR